MSGVDPRFVNDKRSPLAKLLSGQAIPHIVFPFDGCGGRFKGQSFALRSLTASEQQKAQSDALRFLRGDLSYDNVSIHSDLGDPALQLEIKVQLLALALVDPSSPKTPLAASAEEVRRLFEQDEIHMLFNQLVDYQAERSPLSSGESLASVLDLVDSVGKGLAPQSMLSRFDFGTRGIIIISLANRLWELTKPRSLDTSPSTDSVSDSSGETHALDSESLPISSETP